MLGAFRDGNWHGSPARLLLLSKFRNGDSPSRYRDAEYWESALKEKPAEVIQRFINDGMLAQAELHVLLDYKFKQSDLKSRLKQLGLRVSGRKGELVQRLIDHDATGMRDATKDLDLYRCTSLGLQLVEDYLSHEEVKRDLAERETLRLLAQRDFFAAIRTVAQFEASQVFPRGLGIDWKNYEGTSTIEALQMIFSAAPAILSGIAEDRLKQLRLAAGMMELWGTNAARPWLPKGFETGHRLDGDVASRMLIFAAAQLRDMRSYSEAGIGTVEILVVGDAMMCPECRKLSGRKYGLVDAPELPHARCTSELGCRCTTVAADL